MNLKAWFKQWMTNMYLLYTMRKLGIDIVMVYVDDMMEIGDKL